MCGRPFRDVHSGSKASGHDRSAGRGDHAWRRAGSGPRADHVAGAARRFWLLVGTGAEAAPVATGIRATPAAATGAVGIAVVRLWREPTGDAGSHRSVMAACAGDRNLRGDGRGGLALRSDRASIDAASGGRLQSRDGCAGFRRDGAIDVGLRVRRLAYGWRFARGTASRRRGGRRFHRSERLSVLRVGGIGLCVPGLAGRGAARAYAEVGGVPVHRLRPDGGVSKGLMDQQITTSKPPIAAASVPARTDRRWQMGVGLLLVLLVVAGAVWWATRSDTSVRYTTVPLARGAVTRTVTATGTVNPVLTIIVGSYVSGVIRELFCDYNTRVKQGQVCAKIDPRPYQSVVDQDKANLDVAKAQLEKDKANVVYAQVNYERNRQLALKNYVSRDVADIAKSQLDQGTAQVELDAASIVLRQAELDAATINLGYTDIASPVDGTVVSRAVTMGQTVAATLQTPTLFLIATDLTKMEVDTNVSESDIGPVKPTNPSTFTVDAWPG